MKYEMVKPIKQMTDMNTATPPTRAAAIPPPIAAPAVAAPEVGPVVGSTCDPATEYEPNEGHCQPFGSTEQKPPPEN